MTVGEAQRAVLEVVDRARRLAERDGTSFIRVSYDADRGLLLFGTIPAEHVKVSYDRG